MDDTVSNSCVAIEDTGSCLPSCENDTSEVKSAGMLCGYGEISNSESKLENESPVELNITSQNCDMINDEQNVVSLIDEATVIDHQTTSDNEIDSKLNQCDLGNGEQKLLYTDYKNLNESMENLNTQVSPKVIIESEKINLSHDNDYESCTMQIETTTEERLTVNENHEKTSNCNSSLCYNWTEVTPILLCSATEEYQPTAKCENFTKGCDWSPDGTCLLVPSEDFRIRVYELPRELYTGNVSSEINLPPLTAALSVKEGGIIYDSCWFPMMNSWDPSTCCFASTSRESPVHLWDAFTGELRATYRAYNQVDEVEAAISVRFVNSGAEVWCGFKGALRTFDTSRPGRQVNTIYLKKDIPNMTGIVSCIRENPAMPGLIAFGSYSKTIGLYKDGPLCALETASGVTQIEFSPCGMKLYSAVRRNNELLCWDLRNPGVVLYSLLGRQADTNQRIQFSMTPEENELVSGGTDGAVSVWQLDPSTINEGNVEIKRRLKLSRDCINGVSLHRCLPIMATGSGQRICEGEDLNRDNSVRLWWCGLTQ